MDGGGERKRVVVVAGSVMLSELCVGVCGTATFLKENEVGGTSSFSDDGNEKWEHRHAMGRPSDFFEQKSRNLDHVELSSPSNTDEIMVRMMREQLMWPCRWS